MKTVLQAWPAPQ